MFRTRCHDKSIEFVDMLVSLKEVLSGPYNMYLTIYTYNFLQQLPQNLFYYFLFKTVIQWN